MSKREQNIESSARIFDNVRLGNAGVKDISFEADGRTVIILTNGQNVSISPDFGDHVSVTNGEEAVRAVPEDSVLRQVDGVIREKLQGIVW